MSISPNDLSEREIEILRLVATGVGNKEIAQRLSISVNTVKVHLRNIFVKIGATTRTEAAMYAVSMNLVEAQLIEPEPVEDVFREALVQENAAQKTDEARPVRPRQIWTYLMAVVVVFLVTLLTVWVSGLARPAPSAVATFGEPMTPTSSATEPVWSTLAPLLTPRVGMGVAIYENSIYVIAGKTLGGVTGDLEYYNISENRWQRAKSKNVAVNNVQAAVLAGKIFVPGGEDETGKPTDILEIYSPREDQWTRGRSLPQPLSRYALAAFEGKLYVFGGWDGQEYLDTVYVYDPDDDRWTEKSPLTSPRAYAAAVVAGGKVYLIGGYDGKSVLRLNEMYLADEDLPNLEPWRARTELPLSRYQMGAVNLADMIYVVGGRGENDLGITILNYSPTADEWQQMQTPPGKQRYGIGLAGLGSRLYVVGGEIDENISAQLDAYQAIYLLLLPILP